MSRTSKKKKAELIMSVLSEQMHYSTLTSLNMLYRHDIENRRRLLIEKNMLLFLFE